MPFNCVREAADHGMKDIYGEVDDSGVEQASHFG